MVLYASTVLRSDTFLVSLDFLWDGLASEGLHKIPLQRHFISLGSDTLLWQVRILPHRKVLFFFPMLRLVATSYALALLITYPSYSYIAAH
jgi:hypothetical protein